MTMEPDYSLFNNHAISQTKSNFSHSTQVSNK